MFSFFLFSTGYSVFSIDCLSCNNSPDEGFLRIRSIKKPKLFSSFLMQDSTCIRFFPPLFLFMYNLSTLLFVCNAVWMPIVFLDFLSKSFNSLSFLCSIPAPNLNTSAVHVFIAVILFFLFSFDFRTSRSLHLTSLIIFLSSHFLWYYPIQLFPNICILPFRPPLLLH